MKAPPTSTEPFELLAGHLTVLSSSTRLALLHSLRRAQPLHAIRVTPSGEAGAEGRPDRPISRQAVSNHLRALSQAGLLRRLPGRDDREGDHYVLRHDRLFALVDELQGLAKLRPLLAEPLSPDQTLEAGEAEAAGLPRPPRLLVAYGGEDGVAFPLRGPEGTCWRIGRDPGCEVVLDHDPYASGQHATVERDEEGFLLVDEGSRNGTWVNWELLEAGRVQALAPGDLLTVGRTQMVFQA